MPINIYRFFVYATSKITTLTSFPDLPALDLDRGIGESRKHWIVRSSQTMTNCLIPLSLCIVILILCFSSTAYSSSDWNITLRVSGGGIYDYCIAGVKAGASDGRDSAWDIPSPPDSPNETYIYTYFPHAEWGYVFNRFRQDIKAPDLPKEWTFEVSSNVSGELTISWPDIKNAIPDKQAVFVDMDGSGSETNMFASSSFIFVNNGSPRKFLVRISEGVPLPKPPQSLTARVIKIETRKGLRYAVQLYWTANTESDLAGYNVYRSTTRGSGYQKINAFLVLKPNYLDKTIRVKDNPYYFYIVTAVNTSGMESGYSNEAGVTTK